MSWLPLLVSAIRALASLAVYLRNQQLLSNGEAIALADVLQEQAHEIDKGRAARIAQRVRDAGRVPVGGDPFSRD